jgi:hypothetical protein
MQKSDIIVAVFAIRGDCFLEMRLLVNIYIA